MNKIEAIAEHFGMNNQMSKTVEELSELMKVICKMQTEGFKTKYYIYLIEEIADVEIMLEQLKYLYAIDEESIDEVKEAKIERTIGRHEI